MKWIYGKQDFKTLSRGQENCYLLTNGLGGFSSLTMTGSVTRNDHALLMACTKAPNHRYNLIHRLKEEIRIGEEKQILSTQEFADGTKEEGYQHLSAFFFEDTPVWRWETKGVRIRKELGMAQLENTVAVVYEMKNQSLFDAELVVTPFLQFVRKGEDLTEEQVFERKGNTVSSDGLTLYFETDGEILPEEQTETYYYSYDACDGRRESGTAKAVLKIRMQGSGRRKKDTFYRLLDGTRQKRCTGSDCGDKEVQKSAGRKSRICVSDGKGSCKECGTVCGRPGIYRRKNDSCRLPVL